MPVPHVQPFAPDAEAGVTRVKDAEWARGIRVGEVQAFEGAFRTYYAELAGYAYRFVRSQDVAADVVQSVFTSLWADRARLAITGTLAQYLYGAVRYNALNHLRHENVARRWLEQAEVQEQQTPARVNNDGEATLGDADLALIIRRALATLSDRVRTVGLLRWQRQLSYAEIAESTGLSVKTVEVYLARAARVLRASQAFARYIR